MFRCVFLFLFLTVVLHGQTQPDAILQKVDQILAESTTPLRHYPPEETVLRVFKYEKQCEIWARGAGEAALSLVVTLPVCALDIEPGPKLRTDYRKTPEGFFQVNFNNGFWSSQWFMWINLDDLEAQGEPGQGSCFKTFVNYPTSLDRFHTRLAGYQNPGGAIFAHGNCVSAGCISFKNRNYLPVFAYSRHAWRAGVDHVQIHILPFRFNQFDDAARRRFAAAGANGALTAGMLMDFWRNLELGFESFNANPRRLQIQTSHGALYPGRRDYRVADLKRRLKQQGFYDGEIDDNFGVALQDAVRRFQRGHGLTVDGVVGVQSMRALEWFPPGYQFDSN